MTNHTPGPWHQAGTDNVDAHWMRAVRSANGTGVAWCGQFPEGEAHANARLIAAAPEMLQLLQRFAEFARSGGDFGYPLGSLQELNEVISKATGQS